MSTDIYKVTRRIVVPDDQLPFTNVQKRIKKSQSVTNLEPSQYNGILRSTYYKAFPKNIHPLEKLTTMPTLATTIAVVKDAKDTKYCKFSHQYERCLRDMANMEGEL